VYVPLTIDDPASDTQIGPNGSIVGVGVGVGVSVGVGVGVSVGVGVGALIKKISAIEPRGAPDKIG